MFIHKFKDSIGNNAEKDGNENENIIAFPRSIPTLEIIFVEHLW